MKSRTGNEGVSQRMVGFLWKRYQNDLILEKMQDHSWSE